MPAPFVENAVFFPLDGFSSLVKDQVTIVVWVCKVKDTVNRTKRPPTDWERIFTNPKSDRGLIYNIYVKDQVTIVVWVHFFFFKFY